MALAVAMRPTERRRITKIIIIIQYDNGKYANLAEFFAKDFSPAVVNHFWHNPSVELPEV
jgi:hypothetical protein